MAKFANYISTRIKFDQRIADLTFPDVSLSMVMTAVLAKLNKDNGAQKEVQVPVIATRIADRLANCDYVWFYDSETDTRYYMAGNIIGDNVELIALYNAFPFENGMYCVMSTGAQVQEHFKINTPVISDTSIIDRIFGFSPVADAEDFHEIERALIHISHEEPGAFWPWYVAEQEAAARKKESEAAAQAQVELQTVAVPLNVPSAEVAELDREEVKAEVQKAETPPIAMNQMERAFEDARSRKGVTA